MGYVRVRPASAGGPCAVRHPEHGELVVPNPALPYADDDPVVLAYPWLFVTEEQLTAHLDAQPAPGGASTSIEQATRAPGERRSTRRTGGRARKAPPK